MRRIIVDTLRWWPVSGKHRRAEPTAKPKPMPTEPQVQPDPANPGFDQPKTFGKGWR